MNKLVSVTQLSATALLLLGSPALAQTKDDFTGVHLGVAAGAVNHHFVIELTSPSGATSRSNVLKWGAGYQVFAGYDVSIGSNWILGAEIKGDFGGRSAISEGANYRYGLKPRYGLSGTARIGYQAGESVLVYAGGGFGTHKYRTIASGNVAPGLANSLDSTESFILRAGSEFRISKSASVRLEYEHLDGTRNAFMIGIPIRF